MSSTTTTTKSFVYTRTPVKGAKGAKRTQTTPKPAGAPHNRKWQRNIIATTYIFDLNGKLVSFSEEELGVAAMMCVLEQGL